MSKFEKSPKAKSNSFGLTIKGLSANPLTNKSQVINAGVLFTSDDHGETLSIFDTATKRQIILPFEEVEQLIAHVRNNREVPS